MKGRIISTKMKNTVTVIVEKMATHPLYKKTYVRTKRFLADTASTAVKEGDLVELVKIRPISKNKHWKVAKVIGRDLAEVNEEKLKAEAESIIAEVLPAGRQVMPEEKEKEADNKGEEIVTDIPEKAKSTKKAGKDKKLSGNKK